MPVPRIAFGRDVTASQEGTDEQTVDADVAVVLELRQAQKLDLAVYLSNGAQVVGQPLALVPLGQPAGQGRCNFERVRVPIEQLDAMSLLHLPAPVPERLVGCQFVK